MCHTSTILTNTVYHVIFVKELQHLLPFKSYYTVLKVLIRKSKYQSQDINNIQ
jgi:hypothetical protein